MFHRPLVALSACVACALATTGWGCSTTYQAMAPRPVQAGNVQTSVEVVRGTTVAETRVTDVDPHGRPGWGGSGHLAFEWPAVSAGGIGAGVTAELRFHHAVRLWGDWRLAFGLPFGWAGCRAYCPQWGLRVDDQTTSIDGIFAHMGATASVARLIAAGRWLFVPSLGFRTSAYHLGARSDFAGERFAVAAGPVATLGVLRPHSASPRSRRGIELTVGALGAYGRAPRDTVWLLGIGWVFIDVD
jgi:hypothetical protein